MNPCNILRTVNDPFGESFHIMQIGTDLHFHTARRAAVATPILAEFADYVRRTQQGVAAECEMVGKERLAVAFIYRTDGYYAVHFGHGPLSVSFILPSKDAEWLADQTNQTNATSDATQAV